MGTGGCRRKRARRAKSPARPAEGSCLFLRGFPALCQDIIDQHAEEDQNTHVAVHRRK